MATVVWTAIFLLLCVELFILLLLCAPLPFRLQSGIAKFLVDTKLARKMRTAMWYLTLAVTLGVVEALQTIYKLEAPVEKAEDPMMGHNLVSVTIHEYKIRKFRAHRVRTLRGSRTRRNGIDIRLTMDVTVEFVSSRFRPSSSLCT
mmetsp:Transcript_18071/g.37510  ORF Transcript_18071/g.37510 Transcript_18071/m.37510 type:complete len:146 (-) Transcript_18071:1486-1923(-)